MEPSSLNAVVEQLRSHPRRDEVHALRPDRPLRILALDGGGIRGLIPARVLQTLEEMTGRPIADCFDLIAGTSTGGILTLGLTVPGAAHQPRWSAADLVGIYRDHGREIFRHSLLRALGSFLFAKYSPGGLERELREHVGDARLGDALTEVLVTSWDLSADEPRLFSSLLHPDIAMREVGRATSAAPTYFPPLWLDDHALVDGGVVANDPAMLAWLTKRDAQNLQRQVVLLSLGTGAPKSPDPSKRRFWGALPWARPIIDLLLAAPSDLVDLQLQDLAASTGLDYVRLQPDISGASPRLDDVDRANIEALERAAEALITAREADLRRIAALV